MKDKGRELKSKWSKESEQDLMRHYKIGPYSEEPGKKNENFWDLI